MIELLSDSTVDVDRTLKKALYQDRFRTPEYFWFSPDTLELNGLRLVSQVYQPIVPNRQGLFWSESLDLYLGIHKQKLRYFNLQGELLMSPEEAALDAQRRSEQLAAQLRSLGVVPDA